MLKQIGSIKSSSPKWLTVAETAKSLYLSESSVRNRISAGKLPVKRLGRLVRIYEFDVEKLRQEERARMRR